jgi:steroid delta-isomerase-like uncharacterized protein
MTTEDNKRLTARWFEEVFNQGNLATVDELLAPAAVSHMPSPAPDVVGPEAFKQVVRDFRTGLPDLHVALDDLIAEGDQVVTRWTLTGTHRGTFMGIPPTGNRVTATGISIVRFDGGQEIEAWNEWDAGGLGQQLRAAPAAG